MTSMKKIFSLLIIVFVSFYSCKKDNKVTQKAKPTAQNDMKIIQVDTLKMTNGFDFPVGKPDAKGYYNAQKFQKNHHLGDDWNATTGGNTDLGDPIYAIANGYVTFAENIQGGWGNVIRITHYIDAKTQVESLYAHCLDVHIKAGDYVQKGDTIATIGNNDGQYLAHLHLELRSTLDLPIGGGYSTDTTGFLDPTVFIKNHRE